MNVRGSLRLFDLARFLALALITSLILAGCSRQQADADRLASMLEIKPGMVVADIGAGSGWMTLIMGTLVGPTGHVFSTEIDPGQVAKIRSAVAEAHLTNVTVVQASASDTGLPPGCCDAIILSRVYHHLTDPVNTDLGLFRATRPNGKLAVLDFRPTILLWPWTPKGLPPNREGHGIDPVTVVSELTHAGFEYLNMDDPWPGSWFISTYCVLFTKPPQAAAQVARPPASPGTVGQPSADNPR